VFADGDAKGEAVEGDVLAAKNGDVLQIEEQRSHRRKFTLPGWGNRRGELVNRKKWWVFGILRG
jgi:hypothetical protein